MMKNNPNSVLVVGFNTRPLVYSLNKAGYDVYAVDFFGDLDLYSHVKDFIIITKELSGNYNSLRERYSKYLADYSISLLQKHQNINFLLIGSGLDDAYNDRERILNKSEVINLTSVNNCLSTVKKARDIDYIFKILKVRGFCVPISFSFEDFGLENVNLDFPFILKKRRSAGGLNVFKIEDKKSLYSKVKSFERSNFSPSEWLVQEYIDGIPVSCTIISNGIECEIISINRQIIGKEFLNPPKNFIYCGNIVPSGLSESEEKKIAEISKFLAKNIGLRGINGFDFVIKNQTPFFMECNPRIPGSIRASESALNINLLDLHIKSFTTGEWKQISKIIKSSTFKCFSTKLVVFALKTIEKNLLDKINHLKFVHDKTEPIRNVLKGEPLCTILYGANSLLESYNGAKNIVIEINKIIE
ncbi:hypothetical protein LCGC14_1361310 [marine sediment metagenome]|uniref:ATP-grasp domain-containing protein n=1 Tax=marine sediment metagenome TaxID=412755 RepID=A0A0F9K8Q1_9ZZZZ